MCGGCCGDIEGNGANGHTVCHVSGVHGVRGNVADSIVGDVAECHGGNGDYLTSDGNGGGSTDVRDGGDGGGNDDGSGNNGGQECL